MLNFFTIIDINRYLRTKNYIAIFYFSNLNCVFMFRVDGYMNFKSMHFYFQIWSHIETHITPYVLKI